AGAPRDQRGHQVEGGEGQPAGECRCPSGHDSSGINRTDWVANWGGHTTARRPSPTHSQITLAALRLAPASEVPGRPKARPLPFGNPPSGMLVVSAAEATAGAVNADARGITSLNRAHAAEYPASAGALISW